MPGGRPRRARPRPRAALRHEPSDIHREDAKDAKVLDNQQRLEEGASVESYLLCVLRVFAVSNRIHGIEPHLRGGIWAVTPLLS